jgi:hypothetical protein
MKEKNGEEKKIIREAHLNLESLKKEEGEK